MTNEYYGTPELYKIEDATIAVRTFGSGPCLLFIHGYPVNGYTWRKLLPTLSKQFTCIVIDLPGLGDSQWTEETDFTFTAQCRRICALLNKLGFERYSLIAHNTGATIARMVALEQPNRIEKLIILIRKFRAIGHRLFQRTKSLLSCRAQHILFNWWLSHRHLLSQNSVSGSFIPIKNCLTTLNTWGRI